VKFWEPVICKEVEIRPDLVILSAAVARAITILSKKALEMEVIVANVD